MAQDGWRQCLPPPKNAQTCTLRYGVTAARRWPISGQPRSKTDVTLQSATCLVAEKPRSVRIQVDVDGQSLLLCRLIELPMAGPDFGS